MLGMLMFAHVAVIVVLIVVAVVVRNLVDGKLCYRDFVWFLISEEDKRHPRRSVANRRISFPNSLLITSLH